MKNYGLHLSVIVLLILATLISCSKEKNLSSTYLENLDEQNRIVELGLTKQIKIVNDILNHEVDFDHKGRITSERWFNPKGIVVNKRINLYRDNLLVRTDWYRIHNHKKSYYEYEYDNRKNLIRETRFRPNGRLMESITYEYNQSDLLAVEKFYRSEDDLFRIREYIYDNRGNNVEFIETDFNHEITNRQKYFYDDFDRKTMEKRFPQGNKLSLYKTFSYNDKGRLVLETEYDAEDNLIRKGNYSYCDQDLVKEITWDHVQMGVKTVIQYNYK